MARFLLLALLLPALVAPAGGQILPLSLSSKNLPPSIWACEPQGVSVVFAGISIQCGTELPSSAYASPPTVTFPGANTSVAYTIIIVDRDLPTEGNPVSSPQALLAVSGVGGDVLQTGFKLDGASGPAFWMNYTQPTPAAGSGCHRIYVIVYAEPVGYKVTAPRDIVAGGGSWDFYVWSMNQQYPSVLQKVASAFFNAQNPAETGAVSLRVLQGGPNTSSCAAPPPDRAAAAYALPAGQDSSFVNPSVWDCSELLQVSFPAGAAACGASFRQQDTWAQPYGAPRVAWPDAAAGKFFTVVIVDRDAVNRRSPLLMAAFSNIPGSLLQTGFNGTADQPGVTAWLPYVNPSPAVNSGCHRYYVLLYQQSLTSPPFLFVNFTNPAFRVNFNFPGWAKQQTLSLIAATFFQTQSAQNAGENLRDCQADQLLLAQPQPVPQPAPSQQPPAAPVRATPPPPPKASAGRAGARRGGAASALALGAAAAAALLGLA